MTHDGRGAQSIWLVELDGSGALSGTRRLDYGFYPDFSPDGELIRYWIDFTVLSLIEPDGEEPTLVLRQQDGGYWAPDANGVLSFTDGELQLVDRAGAPLVAIPVVVEGALDWQRVAG